MSERITTEEGRLAEIQANAQQARALVVARLLASGRMELLGRENPVPPEISAIVAARVSEIGNLTQRYGREN